MGHLPGHGPVRPRPTSPSGRGIVGFVGIVGFCGFCGFVGLGLRACATQGLFQAHMTYAPTGVRPLIISTFRNTTFRRTLLP